MKSMKEFELKYGNNPNQKPAKIYMHDGSELPIEILCGRPGYINFLDAFNSWQLVKELKAALGLPAVTSFKHVSPTSAAVGIPLSEKLKKACFVDDIPGLDESPLACAYARACNIPANLENSAVATGLENVSFHFNSPKGQCQGMFELLYNCTHFTY